MGMGVKVRVWGDYALFSRPEMKVERCSYDVITPSAARGILEAIYWHPGMKWCIDKIYVKKPVKFTSVRRNEVKSKVSASKVLEAYPYVGYLHTERPGRVSLALDMIEELRAVLADRFVLSLVNKKIVNGKNFTKKENGAVLMDDELRKKLLVEWQKKKKETITHPFLKEKVEWGMVPYVQAMLLARYLRGDLDSYPVFLWK